MSVLLTYTHNLTEEEVESLKAEIDKGYLNEMEFRISSQTLKDDKIVIKEDKIRNGESDALWDIIEAIEPPPKETYELSNISERFSDESRTYHDFTIKYEGWNPVQGWYGWIQAKDGDWLLYNQYAVTLEELGLSEFNPPE